MEPKDEHNRYWWMSGSTSDPAWLELLTGPTCVSKHLLLALRPPRAAIRTREEAMSRHVEDSLALLPVLEAHAVPVRGSDTLRLIDVGSGGGLPGLLLAIARPQW